MYLTCSCEAKSMKRTKILITCALGDYMRAEVDCIKAIKDETLGQIEVCGTDIRKTALNYVPLDHFFKVPRIDEDDYLEAIYSICKSNEIDLLIPTHSRELEMFKESRREFEKIGTKIMVSNGLLNIANDKILCREFMIANGIDVPQSAVVKSFDEYEKLQRENPAKTFCVKLRNSCGGRGFYVIGDGKYSKGDRTEEKFLSLECLKGLFNENDEYLIQEYLPGREFTVDLICDNGTFLCGAVKLNTSMKNGVAENSIIVKNNEALELCKKLSEKLMIDGNAGFDLKESSDGRIYIIDVNPRLTATISLVVKSGLDLVHLGIRKALGLTLPDDLGEAVEGTEVHRKLYDVFEREGVII